MSTIHTETRPPLPLDESLYSLSPDAAQTFKLYTGITDDSALKSHILAMQKKAYDIYPYPGIRSFGLAKLLMSRSPIYPSVMELQEARDGAIFLDVGSAFGGDLRKLATDGWPVQNILAVDLFPGFWQIGHELFKTTPETFPVPFLPGDIFDLTTPPSQQAQSELSSIPDADLQLLKTLVPLRGKVSAVYAGLFFHLFNEEKQRDLAARLAALLSPQPGSVIFGIQVGLPGSVRLQPPIEGIDHHTKVCFSPESWRELWEEDIFGKGSVEVNAELVDARKFGFRGDFLFLQWSVVRL